MDVIVYHGGCPDGWCAAYIAKKKFPEAVLIPAVHGTPPPIDACRNLRVLVVDFSWKRAEVERLAEACKDLVILDHHKTAEKELEGLPYCEFDMTRSGAAMTWDFFFGGQPNPVPGLPFGEKGQSIPRPWYVDYVQDRDLWTWKLPNSIAISAFLMATPMTIEEWDKLTMLSVNDIGRMGDGIVKHINHYVEKVTEQKQVGTLAWPPTVVLGAPYQVYKVAIVNAAYPNISEVCNVLCQQGFDIGMGWFQRGDGLVQFSLRSIGNLDVSEIAKAYGGGGHKNAAGFQVPLDSAMKLISSILHGRT